MTFASLTKNLSLETNDMKHTAIRLACLRRYPQLYDPSRLDTSTMRRALEAESKEDGRAILEAGPRPVFNSRVSGAVIQKGYQSPYLHSQVIVDPMLDTLNRYANQWNKSIYMGPYTALIGPSTSGKSRLLMETAQHICVVYICLRPKDLPGFPPRSALADLILSTAVTDETYYTSLLACIFQVVAKFFSIQHPNENMTDRLKKWNDYTEVASSGSLDIANPTQGKFTADVVKEMQNFLTGPPANLQKAAKDMANSTKLINSRSSIRVLLALDEARALLQSPIPDNDTFFRIFRGTIHNIPTGMGIFILLVDTTSHVANSSIKSTFDSGGRYKFERENRLYEPIYQIASFDAMVPPDPPQSWGALVSPERLFKYGSPIFGAYFCDAHAERQSTEAIYSAILELAFFKLRGPIELAESTRPGLTRAQAFAFLGPTIQPRINGATHLNTELIASHAAHCDYISPKCDMVMSNYPSQFTLAAAAVNYLQDENKWIQCINALITIVLHGLDAAGGAGELASRIILLCAMQKAMSESGEGDLLTGHPVRLVNFLEALTGQKEDDLQLGSISTENRDDLLKNGMIFWNHFSLIKYSPKPEELLQFMYRGMAAQCHANQPGIDQIFTIYLKRDSDCLDAKNVSFCGIQVKNRNRDPNLEDENHNLTDIYAKVKIEPNPYLILYMNLNSQQNDTSTLPAFVERTRSQTNVARTQNSRRASLSFNGMNQFGCLASQELRNVLQTLIDVEPDFVALQSDEPGKRYSKLINPHLQNK
ncbi:hypothetical protein MJO28_014906 [Puccinia striiformis f. sp. tritici]|uniref:Uncharacterized protein n=1 Tax=Puccinia striiformis f. sp. tritici TaxID=168172 RepID=A0ACC0DS77_9BASI|nr:hypothetical protein MJO28_014906 [Puccinia striiformis f. sp. tritici]